MYKPMVSGFAVLALVVTAVSVGRETPVMVDRPDSESYTLVAQVLVDSIRVIAYVDSAGIVRPPDSTLVPPVPIAGITGFQVLVPRKTRERPVAAATGRSE